MTTAWLHQPPKPLPSICSPYPQKPSPDPQIPIGRASRSAEHKRPAVSSPEGCPTPADRVRASRPATADVRQTLNNLGDIVDDGEDIHGEGVNIAARLEGLAEPGGIVISGGVYDQVKNRIDADYEDMGLQEVKNVSAPVQAYRVRQQKMDGDAAASRQGIATEVFDRPAVAVLPFDNMSGDEEQEYFADGITEDIITELAKLE